jgi:hypothetical protein
MNFNFAIFTAFKKTMRVRKCLAKSCFCKAEILLILESVISIHKSNQFDVLRLILTSMREALLPEFLSCTTEVLVS